MKTFIIIFTVALFVGAFALTEEQKAKKKQYAMECGEQNGVPLEEREKLKEGDFTNYNSEKHQCFIRCVMEKAGFLKDGELQENIIIEKLSQDYDKEKLQTIINTCKTEKGANDCETAFKIFQCGKKNKTILE